MLFRRLSATALCACAVLATFARPVDSATGDKQLQRVKGVVGYQLTETDAFKPIFGRLDLPDNAYAVTKPAGTAVLRLADSSEIDIGEKTMVQVGRFNGADQNNPNTIALSGGALHFNIRHPQGGQSSYRFTTATSQIAVRGTEGFLVAGAQGTQVVCVACVPGDVTVQVGTQSITVTTGQTLTVLGTNPLTATPTITTNSVVNNPSVNQFNGNSNPLNPTPTQPLSDPTGSFTGSSVTGVAGGVGGGLTTAAVAGGAGAAVVAAAKGGAATDGPPAAGPLVVQVNYTGASATFPIPFTFPFSQSNATGQATLSCSPPAVIACTVTQAQNGASLSGSIGGNLLAPGTFSISGSGSGYNLPPATFSVYGAVVASTLLLDYGAGVTNPALVVSQAPTGTPLTATVSCAPGASLTITPTSGPSPLTIAVTPGTAAIATPGTPIAAACTITVTGAGGAAASVATIHVNITRTVVPVSAIKRKTL